MMREITADLRAMLSAPNRAQVEEQLRKSVKKYAHRASKLADWLEGNVREGLTFFPLRKITGAGSARLIVWSEWAWKSDDGLEWLASSPMKHLVCGW
jgi:transposase-like protein